jgi:hypothetical protein
VPEEHLPQAVATPDTGRFLRSMLASRRAEMAVIYRLAAGRQDGKGWRCQPVACGRNSKLRHQYALVDGAPSTFPAPTMRSATSRGRRPFGPRSARALWMRWPRANANSISPSQEAGNQSWRNGGGKRRCFAHPGLAKKKWLQKLEARRKRRAIETMIIAIDNSLAVTGHTYP